MSSGLLQLRTAHIIVLTVGLLRPLTLKVPIEQQLSISFPCSERATTAGNASCRGSLRLETLGGGLLRTEYGGLGRHIPRFQPWLCHFLTVWSWACYLISC